MTTFEGIFYGILTGLTELLPLGPEAHLKLAPVLTPLGTPEFLGGALSLGSFLAVFIYFRHDWASMISSVLQLIVFRRIPMTMDERIPLFVAIAIAPLLIAMSLDLTHLLAPFEDPTHIAISLAAIGTLFYVVDYYSRKSKGSYDWNIADALIVGILQMSALIPGCGLITGSLIASSFRNYRRDAAVKFAMFCATPILGVNAFSHLSRTPIHTEGLGMLTFWVCTAVTFLISLMAIGALIRQAEKKSFQIYIAYRAIAGVGVAAWLLWHRQT